MLTVAGTSSCLRATPSVDVFTSIDLIFQPQNGGISTSWLQSIRLGAGVVEEAPTQGVDARNGHSIRDLGCLADAIL
jgi:hypothetical protein